MLIIRRLFFGMNESLASGRVGAVLSVLDATPDKAHVKPKQTNGRSLEQIIGEFPGLVEPGVIYQ